MQIPSRLALVDVETTGANITSDKIIEIAIILTEKGRIVKKFHKLVDPQVHVPDEILKLTGIRRIDIARAPEFIEIKSQIRELLDGSLFVAHNAKFDYGIIKREFMRHDDSFRSKVLCTVKLSRKLYPQYHHHNLDKIITRFNIKCKSRHRALDDALVLHNLLKIFRKEKGSEIDDAIISQIKMPSLPSLMDKKGLEKLPDSPGVYIFYAKDKSVLYVGKSVNIKERVRSHFNNQNSNTDYKLFKSVADIKAIRTPGDVSARILESQLIKSLYPIHNRVSRRKIIIPAACYRENRGYPAVELIKIKLDNLQDPTNILGFFKNMKSAKETLYNICKVNRLCPVINGLENGGLCFYRQLGHCQGACEGKEDKLRYKLRFISAFSGSKIFWPFDSAIYIKEEDLAMKNFHLVSNWCYLGTIEEKRGEVVFNKSNGYFDLDLYKILKRSVFKKSNNVSVISVKDSSLRHFSDFLKGYGM
jgi:DNA polymerase III subunit epsilon